MSNENKIYGNHLTYDKIVIRKYKPKPLKDKELKTVRGFDTETYRGYCKLITSSDGDYRLVNSFEDAIGFLMQHRFRNSYNFFFKYRYDIEGILKYLSPDVVEELIRKNRLRVGDVRIYWIPKKLFILTKNGNSYRFFDVGNFFEGSLEYLAMVLLHKEGKVKGIDRDRLNTDWGYWQRKKGLIIKYCIRDSELTKELGDLLIDMFPTHIGFTPRSFISQADVSKQYFRWKVNPPTIHDLPVEVRKYALASYHGGRFEVVRKGTFEDAWGYDINSAYPYWISKLVDHRNGKWEYVNEWHKDAIYGFYIAKVEQYENDIGIFPVSPKRGYVLYPIGEFYTYLTNLEVQYARKDCEIKILNGWEYFDDDPQYIFKDAIEHLYRAKSEYSKDSPGYLANKLLMNAYSGATYEKHMEDGVYVTGKLFNPVFASYITAGTRMQIWSVIRKNQDSYISSATDGVKFMDNPHISTSKELGGWSEDARGVLHIIRSGVYEHEGKVAGRGITNIYDIDTPYGKYHTIFAYIREHPDLDKYPIKNIRPYHINEVLKKPEEEDLDIVNIFDEHPYTIDINEDYKRRWYERFKNGNDLMHRWIDSFPLIFPI